MKSKKGKGSRWRGFKRHWRHKARKIPVLPVAGAALGLMARGADGTWASPLEAINNGSPAYIAQSAICTYTGLQIPFAGTGYSSGPVKFDAIRTINPFDLGYAPGLKYIMWGAIGSGILKALGVTRKVQPYMNKIPIVKKFTL
jgi:hypothetical protein